MDRENGKFISAKPYAPVNWATGIDANGRPIENPAIRQLKDATVVQPSAEGGHNWNPISFNPATGLVYLAAVEDNSVHAINPNWKINLHDQTTGSDRAYHGPARDEYLKMKSTGRSAGVGSGRAKRSVARGPAQSKKRRNAGDRRESCVSWAGRRQIFCLSRDGRQAAVGVRCRRWNCRAADDLIRGRHAIYCGGKWLGRAESD